MKLILDDGAEVQLQHIKVVDLAPSDVVVVKTTKCMELAYADHIVDFMKHYFPDNQIMILMDGLEIEITRKSP